MAQRTQPTVTVRAPDWSRGLAGTWAVIGAISLIQFGWRMWRGSPDDGALEFVIVASIVVMVGFVLWRYGRLATTAIGDRLLVRNWLTERRVDRVDLDAIGFAGDQPGGAVYATLHDGTRLRLDALGSVTRNDRRIRRVADLKAWLAQPSGAVGSDAETP